MMREWSDDYSIGIEGIDRQHRMIFTLAKDVETALNEGRAAQEYGVLLHALALYVRYHFGFEEQCMNLYHCPVAQQNQAAHATFTARLAEFQQRYAARGFKHVEACALLAVIDEWLVDHICGIDVQLRASVHNAGGGATP
jgi:hemerythrin